MKSSSKVLAKPKKEIKEGMKETVNCVKSPKYAVAHTHTTTHFSHVSSVSQTKIKTY